MIFVKITSLLLSSGLLLARKLWITFWKYELFFEFLVISTLKDPFPGWIDNFRGPIGLMTATGLGRFLLLNKYILKRISIDLYFESDR